MTGLLTIFIALFGLRMLFHQHSSPYDLVDAVLRIGIVLTLATSWPAWRVLGYDMVIQAPREIAGSLIVASGLGSAKAGMIDRIQNADDGLVAMTAFGSGRLTGGVVGGSDRGDSFDGIAMGDQTGFSWGRVLFMVAIIAPYAVTHVMAGLLLAIAPLAAGLLLFTGTQGLFSGWVRGLVFCAIGSLALTIVYATELAMIAPWITDVLRAREQNVFTPSAPTELLVFAVAFCFINIGILAVVMRLAFMPGQVFAKFILPRGNALMPVPRAPVMAAEIPKGSAPTLTQSRVQVLSDSIARAMQREQDRVTSTSSGLSVEQVASERTQAPSIIVQTGLGSGRTGQRTRQRTSLAGERRDGGR